MSVLIAIALKSVLVAGLTLGLLALLKKRSAAERSWIAHMGLFALVIVALAPMVLTYNVEAPAIFSHVAPIHTAAQTDTSATTVVPSLNASNAATTAKTAAATKISPVAAVTAFYALPAAILLIITFLALCRLVALHARADVLVDGHWLSALARAQRRMGFKHGTALLTSNELASPISWGLMRPIILLNSRAVEASGEAEAIIAHELAHVAAMDWAKLLLARVATALFWFNPLVWMLAREAHQLREETADDAVLASNIPDTDYAQLLVGVARHECAGLLLGAHGVAPSRSSLARRVARVLDGHSVRGPAARSFALGVFAGALLVAAPLAALTVGPKGTSSKPEKASASSAAYPQPYYTGTPDVPADLPSIISSGVAATVETAVSAVRPHSDDEDFQAIAPNGASVVSTNGMTVARAPSGATVTVYPPDRDGRRKVVARAPNGAVAVSYADDDEDLPGAVSAPFHRKDDAMQQAIAMKAVGVTPEYAAAMRASAHELNDADLDDLIGMKAVGVTPGYVRDLVSAGLRDFDAGDISGARAVGVDAAYIREMRAAGMGDADLSDLTGARAAGVTGAYIQQMRLQGYDGDIGDFTALRSVAKHHRPPPSMPPLPPKPPGG